MKYQNACLVTAAAAAALVLLTGCPPTVVQNLPAAATPNLVSVQDGTGQVLQETPNGEYVALTPDGNLYTCEITFQVPTFTTFHIYLAANGSTPQQEIFTVTKYSSDPIGVNYYNHAVTVYRDLQPVLSNNNATQQQTIILTFPRPPFPPAPSGVTASPPGTFPFPGTPLTIEIGDDSGNTTYTGTQLISAYLSLKLITPGSIPPGPGLAAPVITSPLSESATVGQPFSYTITASNSPTSYAASGLPSWLSFDSATHVLSGTPTSAGTDSVSLSATNGSGTGSATLHISVAAAPAPAAVRTTGAFKEVSFSPGSSLTSHPSGIVATAGTNPGFNTPVVEYTKNNNPIPSVPNVPFTTPSATGSAAFGLAFTSDSSSSPNPTYNFGIICGGLDAGDASTSTNNFKFVQLLGDSSHPVNNFILKILVGSKDASLSSTAVPLAVFCSPDGTIAAVESANLSTINTAHIAIYDLLNHLTSNPATQTDIDFSNETLTIQGIQLTQGGTSGAVEISYSKNGTTQTPTTLTVPLVAP